MIFLPSTCDQCRAIALISCVARIIGEELCPACGGTMRALPAAAYLDDDVPLFNELLALCRRSGIAGFEAEQLASAIEIARWECDEPGALRAALSRLPGLEPLIPLLSPVPGRVQRALSMLDTILRARSKTRPSGVVRRTQPSESLVSDQERADGEEVGPFSRTWRDRRHGS